MNTSYKAKLKSLFVGNATARGVSQLRRGTQTTCDMPPKKGKDKDVVKMDVAVNTSIKELHSYASTVTEDDVEGEYLHDSATSTPDLKKGNLDLTLRELQENLMCAMNKNSERIMEKISSNTNAINKINGRLDHLFQDLADTKENVEVLKTQLVASESRVQELEERLDEQERYHRRWNLRLFGLPEREGENLKNTVMEICCAVAPECGELPPFFIDICHRLGPKQGGRTRPVIIRFLSRFTRDNVWRMAKGSDFLQTKKLHFKLDLTAKDKEIRNSKWPQVEAARKQNKKAFFIGVKAVIDGKLI